MSSPSRPVTLVWFRGKDLRVADHEPLREAARAGDVVPLFVLDPFFFAPRRAAELPNRIQFLLGSLTELANRIRELGSRLVVVPGKSVDVVPEVARAFRVTRVVAHRWTEPFGRERDRRVAEALGATPFDLFDGERLAPAGSIVTGAGTPYAVFTAFARAFARDVVVRAPVAAPRRLPPLPSVPTAVGRREAPIPSMRDLELTDNPNLVAPGERAGRARLRRFVERALGSYDVARDRLDADGTSRLSQDIKFGTVSPRAVWSAAESGLHEAPEAARRFTTELVWREFAYDVLHHRPDVLERPFRAAWERFPFREDAAGLAAWIRGETGYPVVDAASRQLLATGFVPNRARMISASFLTKHLLLDFRAGERHFLKFLTDGDWANNDLGWQWAAGSGVDPQPWFRIFNPVAQGERFDPDGAWVRSWLPELGDLDRKYLFEPWKAPSRELERAGVHLGRSYPRPIVDHAYARKRFLATAEAHLGRRS